MSEQQEAGLPGGSESRPRQCSNPSSAASWPFGPGRATLTLASGSCIRRMRTARPKTMTGRPVLTGASHRHQGARTECSVSREGLHTSGAAGRVWLGAMSSFCPPAEPRSPCCSPWRDLSSSVQDTDLSDKRKRVVATPVGAAAIRLFRYRVFWASLAAGVAVGGPCRNDEAQTAGMGGVGGAQ